MSDRKNNFDFSNKSIFIYPLKKQNILEFENKKDSMDDYSKEIFLDMFEYDHKSYYNLDIHEEIDVYYHHDQ